jgi:hypothetical protein
MEAMMKAMMRAIGRMMRAMRRAAAGAVKQTVMIGGKLVTMFLPAAIPAIDELEPEDAVAANDNTVVSENAAIRELAYANLQGRMPTAAQLGAGTALQADWICAMDAEMTRRLLKSSDVEINRHLRGRGMIKGVLAYDPDVIEEFHTARSIDNARMERDLELDQPYRPEMPA